MTRSTDAPAATEQAIKDKLDEVIQATGRVVLARNARLRAEGDQNSAEVQLMNTRREFTKIVCAYLDPDTVREIVGPDKSQVVVE